MSEPAARALLGAMAGSDLCVAYYQDEAGEIVFAPEAEIVPLERVRRRPVIEAAMLVSAASLALLLGACTTYGEEVEALRVDDEPAVMVTAPPTTVVPLALADPPAPANLVTEPAAAEQPCEPRVIRKRPLQGNRQPIVKGRLIDDDRTLLGGDEPRSLGGL